MERTSAYQRDQEHEQLEEKGREGGPGRKKEDKRRRRKEKTEEDTHQPVTNTPNHHQDKPRISAKEEMPTES
jgi:hypothetical protein